LIVVNSVIENDGLVCRECGKFYKFRSIGMHIVNKHHIPLHEYYDKYIGQPDENKCNRNGCNNIVKFGTLKRGYYQYCSNKCQFNDPVYKERIKQLFLAKSGVTHYMKTPEAVDKLKSIFTEKYGVDNPSKLEIFQTKKKQTNLDKFGVDEPFKSEIIKDKIKKTNLDKFGVECVFQSEIIKNKSKQTSLKNHGTEYPSQSLVFKNKVKQNNLKKHGVESTNQLDSVKEKKKKTFNSNYGEDVNFQNEEVKEQIKETNLSIRGVENPSQCPIVKDKKRKTYLDHFGYDHYCKQPYVRQIRREQMIISLDNATGKQIHGMIGKHEKGCLDKLEKLINYSIFRNDRVIGYFPDGLIKELNIIIEFDEPPHYLTNGSLTKKDIIRQTDLENEGYTFTRIKETDWLSKPKTVCEQFKQFIREIENAKK